MIIKESSAPNRLLSNLEKILKNHRIIIAVLVLGLYSGLLFNVGVLAHKKGLTGKIKKAISYGCKVPYRYIKGLTSNPKQITIDIRHKNFQKLEYKRQIALAMGNLFVTENDYVPADIRYKDKILKARIRLKGDNTDHLQGQKWSFRIKISGGKTLWGMKQFSIHHPKTRNYISEWIFHQALKREDVISLRYEFVDVILNGKHLGIYAMEEHFEKRLIEHNQRREGPIVRFNENLLWNEIVQIDEKFPGAERNGYGDYLASDVDAFQTGKILSDSASYLQFIKASSLLESFRRGKLKTSEVFDVHKMATFFAITDMMCAFHGARWHNTRFYYNPVTSLLEPIGFDADSGGQIDSLCSTKAGIYINNDSGSMLHSCRPYYATLFNDESFFREYIAALERVSKPAYLDSFFSAIKEELENNLNILYKEFPYYSLKRNVLYQNQKYIRAMLNPFKGLHAYFRASGENRIQLDLGSIQSFPIEVIKVSYKDSVIFNTETKALLHARLRPELVDYQTVSFILPEGFVWAKTMVSDLKVHYRLLGTSRLRYESVFLWPYLDYGSISKDFIRQQVNLADIDFLTVDEKGKKILFKSGKWNLTDNLIIPEGYTVTAGEGLKLDLCNSAKILSYSPIAFIGSEENPILIYSSDSTGQGIIVMNAHKESLIVYVNFNNLANPSHNGWELTGAVTFYESPVAISHCQFTRNRSEDALNIIRTEFKIDNTLFSKTSSDAFDSDFSKGDIVDSSFVNCGNDAIDISGTVINLKNIFIDGAGDKGLSVGENSEMNIDQVKIVNSEIAVCSKDMSEITGSDVSLQNNKIGFTVFQKKSEFGAGSIVVSKVEMENISVPYLVETNSNLIIDGEIKTSNNESVKDILYGVKYGKSSR
ncbi:CotH kinase family protein [bacterium]|nr:CotH kinase family protein [bacterium]